MLCTNASLLVRFGNRTYVGPGSDRDFFVGRNVHVPNSFGIQQIGNSWTAS
jgi:hypothetical protein